MPLHRITKSIEFCYGHRLVGHSGKCRYLHGHNGLLEVDIDAEELDAMGMVVDFGEVRDLVKSVAAIGVDTGCRRPGVG